MTKSYTVKNATILHNKISYGIDSTINLTDDEAKKLVDYITPIKVKPQSAPPASTDDTDATANTGATSTNKKSNKKSDKSVNASDSSDASTTATDTIPTAETNATSSNVDSVSAEDTVSGTTQQEATNGSETV